MQLLSHLTLQRHEQDIDGVKADCGEQSRASGWLGIPRIRDTDTDVDLKRLEGPSGQGTLQLVSHREADTGFPQFFAAGDSEAEMVAEILDGRSLKIGTGRVGAERMVGIHVD
jgi:hypothetical protein